MTKQARNDEIDTTTESMESQLLELQARVAIINEVDNFAQLSKCNETLSLLAQHSDPYVRVSVANNIYTPADTLRMLATDENEYVRMTVAESLNTPFDSLIRLAVDVSDDCREKVAHNPNTPKDIATALLGDKDLATTIIDVRAVLNGWQKDIQNALAERA